MFKKTCKKFLSILLCVAVLATCTVLQALAFSPTYDPSADTNPPTFALSKAQGAPGDTVKLELSLLNNPGIGGWKVKLNYDESALELINIDANGAFSGAFPNVEKAVVGWPSAVNDNTNGTMAIFEFKIKDSAKGDYNIEVVYDSKDVYSYSPVDIDGTREVYFETVNGTITVIEKHTHSLKLVEEKAPDCVSDGNKAYYVCEICGKWFEDENAETEISDQSSVVVPAKGHSYVWKYDEKVHWQECEVCGDKTKTEDHVKSETIVDTTPTADKEGKGHIDCTVCGAHLSDVVIPKTEEPSGEPTTKPEPETNPSSSSSSTPGGNSSSLVTNNPDGKGVVETGASEAVFIIFAVVVLAAAGVITAVTVKKKRANR